MQFNDHSEIAGQHSFLSASYYHWLGYNDEQLEKRWNTVRAAARGTALHAFAHTAIQLRIPLHRSYGTLHLYVRDAIKYEMSCEQTLFYSVNAFGTPDTISFSDGLLRIHDLKTGSTKTSFRQLQVYAAYFCLEYGVDPHEIQMEFRIYQSTVMVEIGDPDEIRAIMDRIMEFDQKIELLKARGV